MRQPAPEWGVMFHDGSVMHRWNGGTQRQRAEEYVADLFEHWPEWYGRDLTDNITLAHRDASGQWQRVES